MISVKARLTRRITLVRVDDDDAFLRLESGGGDAELLFGLFAFGDVSRDAENADRLARLIAQRRLDRLEKAAVAVGGEGQPLVVGSRFAGRHRLAIVHR